MGRCQWAAAALLGALVHAPAGAEEPPSPICAVDLSTWTPARGMSGSIVLSAETLGDAVRPALVAARDRACACVAGGAWPTEGLRVRVETTPAAGRATATVSAPEHPALERCVGVVEVTFAPLKAPPPDLVVPGATPGHSTIVYPVVLGGPAPVAPAIPVSGSQ